MGSANSRFSALKLAFVCNVSGKRSCLSIEGRCDIAGFSAFVRAMEATFPRVGMQLAETTSVTDSQLDVLLAEAAREYRCPVQAVQACDLLEVTPGATLRTPSAQASEATSTRNNVQGASISSHFAWSPLHSASHANEGRRLSTSSKTMLPQDTMASEEVWSEEVVQGDLSHLIVPTQAVEQMTQLDPDSESETRRAGVEIEARACQPRAARADVECRWFSDPPFEFTPRPGLDYQTDKRALRWPYMNDEFYDVSLQRLETQWRKFHVGELPVDATTIKIRADFISGPPPKNLPLPQEAMESTYAKSSAKKRKLQPSTCCLLSLHSGMGKDLEAMIMNGCKPKCVMFVEQNVWRRRMCNKNGNNF